ARFFQAELPVGPYIVAGVAVWVFFEIVLMLGLRFPERPSRCHFPHHPSPPGTPCVDVGDRLFCDALFLPARIENRRTITQSYVVALPVPRRRIVNLKKEQKNVSIAQLRRIEDDLDSFGMCPVVAIGRIRHIATGIADACRYHAFVSADEILHAPKTAARKNR